VAARDGSISESSTKGEVESTLFGEIQGKRFYLAEQAPICKGRLRGEFGYMANTPAGRAVLSGDYKFAEDLDVGTRELFEEVALLRRMIPANSVPNGGRRKKRPRPRIPASISLIILRVLAHR
jgi:hypothetical protein